MITLITDNVLKSKLSKSEYESRFKTLLENGLKRIIIRDDKNIANQMDTLTGIHSFAYENNIDIFINCKADDFHRFEDIKGVKGIHLSGFNIQEAIKSGSIKDMNFGTSVHNHIEVTRAILFKPSYVLISPVYETVCKVGTAPIELEKGHELTKILKDNQIESVALGGINSPNISNCHERIEYFNEAAIRSLFYESENLKEELITIMNALNNSKQ